MRTHAKMRSVPGPAWQRPWRGRHAKARALPLVAVFRSPARTGGLAGQEATGDQPARPDPLPAPTADPLPRRIAGQSGLSAYPPGDPVPTLGVIKAPEVSGAPPWELSAEPPETP